MSYKLPASINLRDYAGRPWTDIMIPVEEDEASPKRPPSPCKEYRDTRLLPRKYCRLFGHFPKLEKLILRECGKCGKVLHHSVFEEHLNNPDHKNLQPMVQQTASSSKSSTRNRKAATKPSATFVPAASTSNNHNNSVTLVVPKQAVTTPTPVAAAVPVATPVPVVAAASSNGRSSKHKKSSKSNKRSRKEDKVEHIPALQSPQSHVHPTKVGKQDDAHVMAIPSIPPTRAFGVPDAPVTQHAVRVDVPEIKAEVYVVNEEVREMRFDEPIATSTVSKVVSSRPAFIKTFADSTTTPNNVISIIKAEEVHKSVVLKEEDVMLDDAITVSNDTEENQDRSPVDHMPMSPVAVVNIVPVQNFQYLQQYLQLPTQPIVVTIPCTSPSTHMYSYPKPLTMSTRAIRRIGNTYLLQNQRMNHQRADIQAITSSRGAYSNASTLNHLPT